MELQKTNHLLTINQLELELYLGWPNEERLRKQTVMLDLVIKFPFTPKACESDHLGDTVCYRQLIEKLRETLSDQKFHLIEFVTHEVHRIIKTLVPPATTVSVSLTKRPEIENLGSVTFQFSDLSS